MSQTEGFWSDPSGKLVRVPTTHVRYMIDNPELFGMTKLDIAAAYAKHREPLSWEGKARRELVLDAMRKGWVRVRYYESKGWALEYFAAMTSRSDLKRVVDRLLDSGSAHYEDGIHLSAFADGKDGPKVVRDDDYDFDHESGEGGVLRFIDSHVAETLSGLLTKWQDLEPAVLQSFSYSSQASVLFGTELPSASAFFARDTLSPIVSLAVDGRVYYFRILKGGVVPIIRPVFSNAVRDAVESGDTVRATLVLSSFLR